MKTIQNYILVVDSHRRLSRLRNTHGRYRVGAKSEKEAIALLRAVIKFGDIKVLRHAYLGKQDKPVSYKKVVRERFSLDNQFYQLPAYAYDVPIAQRL